MRIPAYWSKATAQEVDRDGKPATFSCWRWSDTSQQDAQQSALAAASRILRALLSGAERRRYGYGEAALREDVKQRFSNAAGDLIAAITQNSYGLLVLSTAGVMFIDLDFPPIQPGENLRYFFREWFNKAALAPDAQRELAARQRLAAFLADNPAWSARLYRTCAGLRVMATHALFDPAAESTQSLFATLGTDPLYMRLCKTQKCFRARLTPKPWRCRHQSNTIAWPRETADEQRRFDQWQSKYLDRQSNYATCRFLGTLGNGSIHPEIEPIVEIHDRTTRCAEALELA